MNAVTDRHLSTEKKAALGQFFTSSPVAKLMASMSANEVDELHILDPGAGTGSLFSAAVAQAITRGVQPSVIRVTAYEVDKQLLPVLHNSAAACRRECEKAGVRFTVELFDQDFLRAAAEQFETGLFPQTPPALFDLAILNPPYFKINTNSQTRRTIERIGVETTNIYPGFLAAAAKLLKPGGEMIAITPRSFCNGTYFRAFRQWFLRQVTLTRIHSFHSRQEAFREDAVLQETVIFRAVKNARRGRVTVTSSTGPDAPIARKVVSYSAIVRPDDPEHFIRIPTDDEADQVTEKMTACRSTLADLGLTVSTGRVVDFRAKEFLRSHPNFDTAPLIWPTHFDNGYVVWPKNGYARKPESILKTVPNQLVPNEPYVLVRRFSAKEERRRVVAAVYDPKRQHCDAVGFENHLNYFHCSGRGLSMTLARGLAAFMNSTVFDQYFRLFSGHTQVNATDLRNLHYPTREQLERIGNRISAKFPDQDALDAIVAREVFA